MNWVLIAVIAVLAVSTIVGMYRGIIKMIFSVVSLVGTTIVVFMLLPLVTGTIKDNTSIYENIQHMVEEKFVTLDESFTYQSDDEIIDNLDFPDVIKEMLHENNTISKYAELGVNSVRDYLISYISDLIFNVIAFLISFIIVFILFRVLFGFISVIAKLPVIRQVNKIPGSCAGFLLWDVVIWLAFAVITVFGSSSLAKEVFAAVNDNAFLTFIYDKNIIMKYVRIIMR